MVSHPTPEVVLVERDLVIEVGDAAAAAALKHALGSIDVEVVSTDGRAELHVSLWNHNPESRVVSVLNAVDAWLVASEVDSVRIRLDGTSYTLHAPPGL